jgi:hypothetical protein
MRDARQKGMQMQKDIAESGAVDVEYVTTRGISLATLEIVTTAVLRILRPKAGRAYLDGVSDNPWPKRHEGRVARLHELAASRPARGSDPRMGIELDFRDDEQFEIFVDLAPHALHSEIWAKVENPSREWQLFATDDSGTQAYFTLNDEEHRGVAAHLASLGVIAAYGLLDGK